MIFGIPGLKVHCKLFSIERREEKGIRYYSHLARAISTRRRAPLYRFLPADLRPDGGPGCGCGFEFLKFNYRLPKYERCWCRHKLQIRAG
ncbi:MAG: hypothetical protein CM15mP103_05160 [Gammaproteobacteria bacterium]|nr:MAG: hypothetical protein CM15mP103_05160 [Gammaproteobacteria bacterium]